MNFIDFHSHFVGPSFPLNTLSKAPPAQQAFWEGVNRSLADPAALPAALDEGRIAARVINTPLEFIEDAERKVPPGTVERINDSVAELIARFPGRLYGLATVDAYEGDAAAAELERAVSKLGLRGVFIESTKHGLLPDAREAQPTFAMAAALGVPVFLHPVADAQLKGRFKSCGKLSERLVRGTVNSAALMAMLESGMFEAHRNLKVVVTALALGGAFLAQCFGEGAQLGRDAAGRRNVYIDTTGMHPTMIKSSIELLGADRVVTGTDWPVVQERSLPERMQRMLAGFGLSEADQARIAGGNARELLSIH